MEHIVVNGRTFSVLRLLGKGKGGYSYLVTDGQREYVVKQIHHEPHSSFGYPRHNLVPKLLPIAKLLVQLPQHHLAHSCGARGRLYFICHFSVSFPSVTSSS